MSINDKIIARANSLYQDEFERFQAAKAVTISYFWTTYGILALAPILAWCLPASHAAISYIVLFPVFVGNSIGNLWLKKTVTRPKINFVRYTWGWEWAFMSIIIVAWLLGMFRSEVLDLSSYAVVFIGAAVGIGLTIALYPVLTGWQRKRDHKRLDAEQDD